MIRHPPKSTPFPYPTPFRSRRLLARHHDLPHLRRPAAISGLADGDPPPARQRARAANDDGRSSDPARRGGGGEDRKSTRLNSSHLVISYAVFCLEKKIVITI